MSSVVGLSGNLGQANYSASKAGVIGFTKSMAQELASRKVTCNAIAPGFIATEMTDAIPEAAREALLSRIPLRDMGKPEDIANCALFLASDEARYITGQVLVCDGGMCM
jgi:3-oxoacyl-[acyl-carrier protein] reductase